MDRVVRGPAAVTERRDCAPQGCRHPRCRTCGRQFNQRSGGVLNRTCLPSDVIALAVFFPLRCRLTPRGLSGMLALRGIEACHEAVRDRETRLLPIMGEALRRRRGGARRRSDASWHADETCLKVRDRWTCLRRVIDRDGNLVDAMLSEHRDMAAAKAFSRSATATTVFRPDRVTTDGHGSHPRAIRSVPGRTARHRTSAWRVSCTPGQVCGLSVHVSDERDDVEASEGRGAVLVILDQVAAARCPGEGSLHHPAPRQQDEAPFRLG